MIKSEIDILNFENQLMQQRQKLNDLIYTSDNSNNIIIDKINQMEMDISYMEKQLNQLKSNLKIQDNKKGVEYLKQPKETERTNPKIHKNESSTVKFKTEKGKSNIENLFGKKLMGIFASVLIFIGMILFATVIIPYLTDTIKVMCMYLVSTLILYTGIHFMKKYNHNLFFTSLAGLGIGGLYISLFMTNIYFHLIGNVLMYIALLGWGIGTVFLSKMEMQIKGEDAVSVFQIIGRVGVLISVITGSIITSIGNNEIEFFMITLYNLIAIVIFTIIKNNNEKYRIENYVFQIISIFSMSITLNNLYPSYENVTLTSYGFLSMLVILMTIILEIVFGYNKIKSNIGVKITYNLSFIVYFWQVMITTKVLSLDSLSLAVIGYIITLAFILLLEYSKNSHFVGIALLLFIESLYLFSGSIGTIGIIALIVIPCLLYSKYKSLDVYMYIGIGISALWFILMLFSSEPLYTYIVALILLYSIYFYIRKYANNNIRIIGYIVILLSTISGLNNWFYDLRNYLSSNGFNNIYEVLTTDIIFIIPFILTAIIHIFTAKKIGFSTKSEKIMNKVVTAILMCTGWSAILKDNLQIITIPITLCLFVLNSKELLDNAKNRNLVSIYIVIKYTIYMLIVLSAFDVANFAISIMLLLFSLASIIIGFIQKEKGFRIYGLVLSMVSIFKLIMVDAWTGDAIIGAISFILCGGLCFAISFIYNKIQNRIETDKTKGNQN